MRPFGQGLKILINNKDLWPFVWKPLLWAAIFYLLLLLIGIFYLVPIITDRIPSPSWLSDWLRMGGTVLFIILWMMFSNAIFLALSAGFSSLLWDRLSTAVEKKAFGSAPNYPMGCITIVYDSLLRILFSLTAISLTFCLSFLGPLIVILIAGMLSLFDFTCPAYLRRGYTFPHQVPKVLVAKNALSFNLICGFFSLIPFLFVLLIPAFVAGGTILCKESEPAN